MSSSGKIAWIDLDAALERCQALGGILLGTLRQIGNGSRYFVIQDPAGAFAALYETWSAAE